MFTYTTKLWTSQLTITMEGVEGDDYLRECCRERMLKIASELEEMFDWRTKESSLMSMGEHQLSIFARLSCRYGEMISKQTAIDADYFSKYRFRRRIRNEKPHIDCTGFLKGFFIGLLADKLVKDEISSFIINFGGDILIYDASNHIQSSISINWWNGKIIPIDKPTKFVTIFSSDNTSRERGTHIRTSKLLKSKSATIIHWFDDNLVEECLQSDMIATNIVSNRWSYKPNNSLVFYRIGGKVVSTIKNIR